MAGFEIGPFMDRGGVWIDVGVGKDALPMRPLIGRPGIKLKGLSPHHRKLPKGITLIIGQVPEDTDLLPENRGRSRLVTDIFGAVSYCDDPVQSLIYEALLLNEGGIFIAFTELYRLGDIDTWDRITAFFHERLRQSISFQTVYSWGDSLKRYSTYLRIRVEGKSKTKAALPNIFKRARLAIGMPQRREPLWTSPDRKAKIWRMRYCAGK